MSFGRLKPFADHSKAEIYANRPNLQQYCALTGGDAPVDNNPPGVNAVTVNTGSKEKRDTTATTPCKPNILIFAKGTNTNAIANPEHVLTTKIQAHSSLAMLASQLVTTYRAP